MKKTRSALITLMFATLTFCFASCEKDDSIRPIEKEEPIVEEEPLDVSSYLGEYVVKRNFTLAFVMGDISLPLADNLDAEFINIQRDPEREDGIILSTTEGLLLYGYVDQEGLHLQNSTRHHAFTIFDYTPLDVTLSLTHPVIAPPQDGIMDWTSVATGTGIIDLPFNEPSTYTMKGYFHYHTVSREIPADSAYM